jgi:2-(1,2-epoxy-1,2-dihydrophenyl)acetyl-CoA isomerase
VSEDVATSQNTVIYVTDGAVATITLNRPDELNALDTPTKEALLAALREAAQDEQVRAVVLTGSGRAFCAGQDLREHAGKLASGEPPLSTVHDHYNPITLAIAQMPKPMIAAINGVAAGAGAAIAFACDLRIAADNAAFTLAFSQVSLSADSGASWTLPRLVGTAKAIELLFNPQKIGVREASQLGLVNEIVPADRLREHVTALAARLAAGPTVAYASLKASVHYGAAHTLAETLEFEDAMQTRCGATADHREAVEAFLAKRPPDFAGK